MSLKIYAFRFVVVQFIARPAGRSLAHTLATMLMCVETSNKFHCYEPMGTQFRKPHLEIPRFIRRYCLNTYPLLSASRQSTNLVLKYVIINWNWILHIHLAWIN